MTGVMNLGIAKGATIILMPLPAQEALKLIHSKADLRCMWCRPSSWRC
jgi:hypothetical protein